MAQEKEQKERAQRCFVSYLRSVYLMKNKEVFDVFKLHIKEYALSLGLAVAPRVRFLSTAQAQRATKEEEKEAVLSEEEDELKRFKAQLRGNISQSSVSEDSSDGEESSHDQESQQSKVTLMGADDSDEDEDSQKDLDLLTVKRKNVFNLEEYEEGSKPGQTSKKKTEKHSKFTEAKKALKRNFQVNTKVAFNEEGDAVQLWPPVQRAVTGGEEDEEEEVSGINVEKAKERLKREDQEYDKQEYSRKVKAKHREKRLKEKAARREANKKPERSSDEEDEVVAYLANDSEDEFDPSTLPDPDKVHSEEEEEDGLRPPKRQHSSESSGDEEEELSLGRKKKARQPDDEHTGMDTGLSLAEDEELVLHLLGGLV